MHRIACVATLLAGFALTAGAQEAQREPVTGLFPAIGIHYGSPLRASAALGMLVDRVDKGNDGFLAMLEIGQQGFGANAGYFHLFGSFGSGYSLRAAILRTGDEPWTAAEHTTYVGAQLHGMLIFGVGGRVGFMRRVSHADNTQHDTIVPVGLSVGF